MKRIGCILAISAFGVLAAGSAGAQDLRERQTAACMNDAMRLCSDSIPDEGRISACMNAKRAELNPGCRVFFSDASTGGDDMMPSKTAMKRSRLQPVSVR